MFDTESGLPEMFRYSAENGIIQGGRRPALLSLSIFGKFEKWMIQKADNNLVELIRYQI